MPSHEGLNTELLLRVKAHILEEPKRLLMNHFLIKEDMRSLPGKFTKNRFIGRTRGYNEPKELVLPSCRTIGCIAGWTCELSGVTTNISYYPFADKARELLNIHTTNLFFLMYWPANLRDAYLAAKSRKKRAVIVGQAIDAFINGGF